MGGASSKAARSGTNAVKRRYPTRIPTTQSGQDAQTGQATGSRSKDPPASVPRDAQGPRVHTDAQPSSARTEEVNADAKDPDFAARLSSVGPVRPSPTMSHSSAFNVSSTPPRPESSTQPFQPRHGQPQIFPSPADSPAIQILEARRKLAEHAEEEFNAIGRKGFAGRRFLDVSHVRQALILRDEKGLSDAEIERELGFRKGVASRLGPKGVIGNVGGAGDLGREA